MSGASTGRPLPRLGGASMGRDVPQARPRPPLVGSSQALCSMDTSLKVNPVTRNDQDGRNSSEKDEVTAVVPQGDEDSAAVSTAKKAAEKQSSSPGMQRPGQQSDSQKGSTVKSGNPNLQGAQEVWPGAANASGVHLPPPAQRLTLQQNLQQCEVRSTMAGLDRTTSLRSMEVAQEESAEKSHGVSRSAEFKQAEKLPKTGDQTRGACAPELQVAEEIPALVSTMEELKGHKQMLQMEMDCVYKLKTANPNCAAVYDRKLHSLSLELGDLVKQMDTVLGRMGPLAESYRNQERFASHGLSFESGFSSVIPEEAQQVTRPVLQAAKFSFQKGEIHKQESAAVPEEPHGPQAPALQVPGGTEQQQQKDNGHVSINPGDGVAEQISTGDGGHVPEGSVSGNVQPVWGISEDGIEVDGLEESPQSNEGDFPPLPSSTEGVSGPSSADTPHVSQGPEPRQVPPSNAWSIGAPSISSAAHYTGEAFKRRNVVRFKHRGAKVDLPDRRLVVRELLCHQMGFTPADILAVINLPDRQGYDISFELMSHLDRFWDNFPRFRGTNDWSKFFLIPISKPDTVNTVNIIFWNEAVPPQDIVVWLRRHCDMVSDLAKDRDDDGIWTGGWKVLVKLRQHNNITWHLQNSFFIGGEKGVCFYPGQPRKCFKCGRAGHVAIVCSVVKCNLCGEVSSISAWHNISEDLLDEELLEADAVEEEALMSGSILTRQEVQQGSGTEGPEQEVPDTVTAQGSMEVVPEGQHQSEVASYSSSPEVFEESKNNKRGKKDKSSRNPEKEYSTTKNARKKVHKGSGVLVISNRDEVLSESEGELKKIEDECERDTEDPPTKRKPYAIESQVESDMETGGKQGDSDL